MIILKSIVITSVISFLCAFGLHNIIGFWPAFSLTYAAQLIIGFAYSSWKISREQGIVDSFQSEIDELIELNTVVIECPCGKNKFENVIFMGLDNVFKCDVCNSKFKADIAITSTLLTEPVNISKTFDDLIKEKEL